MIARKIEKELQHFHDAHEKRHCRLLAHVRMAKPLSFANLASNMSLLLKSTFMKTKLHSRCLRMRRAAATSCCACPSRQCTADSR